MKRTRRRFLRDLGQTGLTAWLGAELALGPTAESLEFDDLPYRIAIEQA